MTNNQPDRLSKPSAQPSTSLNELIAIRKELESLNKEVKALRSNLTKQIASGIALTLIILSILGQMLRGFLNQ